MDVRQQTTVLQMLTATVCKAPPTAIVGAVIMEMGQQLAQDAREAGSQHGVWCCP